MDLRPITLDSLRSHSPEPEVSCLDCILDEIVQCVSYLWQQLLQLLSCFFEPSIEEPLHIVHLIPPLQITSPIPLHPITIAPPVSRTPSPQTLEPTPQQVLLDSSRKVQIQAHLIASLPGIDVQRKENSEEIEELAIGFLKLEERFKRQIAIKVYIHLARFIYIEVICPGISSKALMKAIDEIEELPDSSNPSQLRFWWDLLLFDFHEVSTAIPNYVFDKNSRVLQININEDGDLTYPEDSPTDQTDPLTEVPS